MLILCVCKVFVVKDIYGKELVVYDTKPIEKLEPNFLKGIEDHLELEPIFLDDKNTIICGGYSESVMINIDAFLNNTSLNKIGKTIDSIRSHNLERRVNIKVVLRKETPYQTFIDVLDIFETKQSMLYGVEKDTLFWIE